MNKMILDKLIKYLREQIDIENISIRGQTNLFYEKETESLQLSSIDFVKMILYIEKEFGIEYEFDTKVKTVNDLVDYVNIKKCNNEW